MLAFKPFTSRIGNPNARVTLARGPKIARVYTQNYTGRVTLPRGTFYVLGNRKWLPSIANTFKRFAKKEDSCPGQASCPLQSIFKTARVALGLG